jgi:hypothetical protein
MKEKNMWNVLIEVKTTKEQIDIRCYADSKEEGIEKAIVMAINAGEIETSNDVNILKAYFRK